MPPEVALPNHPGAFLIRLRAVGAELNYKPRDIWQGKVNPRKFLDVAERLAVDLVGILENHKSHPNYAAMQAETSHVMQLWQDLQTGIKRGMRSARGEIRQAAVAFLNSMKARAEFADFALAEGQALGQWLDHLERGTPLNGIGPKLDESLSFFCDARYRSAYRLPVLAVGAAVLAVGVGVGIWFARSSRSQVMTV